MKGRPNMRKRRESLPEVEAWLSQRLRFAEHPIKRDALVDELQAHALTTWGMKWRGNTAMRRLAEAAAALEAHGTPVVTSGDGLRLARTDGERELAAKYHEKLGYAHFQRAANIRGITLAGELRQAELAEHDSGFAVGGAP